MAFKKRVFRKCKKFVEDCYKHNSVADNSENLFNIDNLEDARCLNLLNIWELFFLCLKVMSANKNSLLWSDIENQIKSSLFSRHLLDETLWSNFFREACSKSIDINGVKGFKIRMLLLHYYHKIKLGNNTFNSSKEFFYNWLLDQLILFENKFSEFLQQQTKSYETYCQNAAH